MKRIFNRHQLPPPLDTIVEKFIGWVTPRATDPEVAFRERNLRIITLVGVCFYVALFVMGILLGNSGNNSIVLNLSVFGVIFLTMYLIHRQKIHIAGRMMTLISFTLLMDSSVAYWSPGTVLMSVIFTFMFLLILPTNRDLIFAILVNIGVYTYIILSTQTESPLNDLDFYSSPVMAWVSTLTGHLIIVLLGIYVRHDQLGRDRQIFLLEQQKKDMLQQFLNNVSHDLNTPITTIKTSLYLLGRKAIPEQERYIHQLEKQTLHLEQAVQNILEMSRLDYELDFTLLPFDMHHAIQIAMEHHQKHATSKQITLCSSFHAESAIINGDAEFMYRAVGNLIDNAITFTPINGVVEVHTTQNNRHLIIQVKDNGVGIAPEHLPHIFERFYRGDSSRNTDTGKTGLGLSISQKIIELHRGTITLTSQLNVGSTFTITLPLARN